MAPAKQLWKGGDARNFKDFAKFLGLSGDCGDCGDYSEVHQFSITNVAEFWSKVWDYFGVLGYKGEHVLSHKKGDSLCEARWFKDSTLNYAENILNLNPPSSGKSPFLSFISEEDERLDLSYDEFHAEVLACTAALRAAGITKGDVVAGWLSNCPYSIIAMLATARIGAIWSSCSPDFGVYAILDRFSQIKPKIIFSQEYYTYKGKRFDLKDSCAEIVRDLATAPQVVRVPFIDSKGDWADFIGKGKGFDDKSVELDFNHPLFIMFSSGTTGKPKCIVHSHGGVLLKHLVELGIHTDLRQDDALLYFTTCGWMMWNWMVSSLLCGARLVLYDGNPFYPVPGRLIEIIEREKVSVAGISAKLIEGLAKQGFNARQFNLSNLRMICSTGSPLSANGFDYVYENIKSDLCLASISGGTDIIGCFVMGMPCLPVYAGEIQATTLGMDTRVYSAEGKEVINEKGELVCCQPFPTIPLKFMGDDAGKSKLRQAYFSKFNNIWTHGDYAEKTSRGGFLIYGRSDNTLNPGGVRIGTAEIYRQVEKVEQVIDSLAVGQQWQGDSRIVLFVVLQEGLILDADLENRIKKNLRTHASPRHVPAKILQVMDLPRTISGKISEEAVRCAIHNLPLNNLGALANPDSVQLFKDLPELKD